MTSPKSPQAHYVIVGNSAAGLNAVEGIRASDPSSPLLLIADENTVAYSRVATPYYISGEIDDSVLFYKSEEYYRQRQVTTLFGHRVVALHADRHQVELADGSLISYRKLLLATGSTPSRPPIKGLERVPVFPHWTLAQAKSILAQTPLSESAAVLGGGFISLLTVNAMKTLKPSIRFTVIERLPQVMPSLLDEQAARMLEQRMVAQGIQVKTGVEATELAELPLGKTRVMLSDGTEQKVDMVVLGTGVRPNVDFLLDSGLKIQRGILVNERMETNLPDVYAAGDCAESFDLLSGERVVHAIWPTAMEQGRVAGSNMAGGASVYPGSLSMNVLDIFGLTSASIGIFRDEAGVEMLRFSDFQRGIYRKFALRDGKKIVGLIAVGTQEEVRHMGVIQSLIRRQIDVSPWKDKLLQNPGLYSRIVLQACKGRRSTQERPSP